MHSYTAIYLSLTNGAMREPIMKGPTVAPSHRPDSTIAKPLAFSFYGMRTALVSIVFGMYTRVNMNLNWVILENIGLIRSMVHLSMSMSI